MSILEFFEPEGIAARGTLVVLPGRGEQPDVYRRFGARLAADAYRVNVVSDPDTDPQLVFDQLAELLGRDEVPQPVVLVGSDAGALRAVAALTQQRLAGVDGLILAGLPVPQAAAASGSWEEELEARTTCPTHRRRISGEFVRPGALYEQIPAADFDGAELAAVTVPVLAIHGQDDPIAPLGTAREQYVAAPELELVSVLGARHDVLNDQTHRSVAATVILWLERLKRDPQALTPIVTLQALEERVV